MPTFIFPGYPRHRKLLLVMSFVVVVADDVAGVSPSSPTASLTLFVIFVSSQRCSLAVGCPQYPRRTCFQKLKTRSDFLLRLRRLPCLRPHLPPQIQSTAYIYLTPTSILALTSHHPRSYFHLKTASSRTARSPPHPIHLSH